MDKTQHELPKYSVLHQIEISCAILKTSISQLAKDWDCSDTHIRQVAKGWTTSGRIETNIKQLIARAKQVVPFDYPTNEQTNEQDATRQNPNIKRK